MTCQVLVSVVIFTKNRYMSLSLCRHRCDANLKQLDMLNSPLCALVRGSNISECPLIRSQLEGL